MLLNYVFIRYHICSKIFIYLFKTKFVVTIRNYIQLGFNEYLQETKSYRSKHTVGIR